MEALMTIERAAQVLGISPWTVRRYISLKKIWPVRIGRRVLLEECELRRLIEEGKSQAAPQPQQRSEVSLENRGRE
jgi:excisionase family DNA binding protein